MKYEVGLLECLTGMIKKGLFNFKEGCPLCQDREVCLKITQIMEENNGSRK